MTQRKQISLAGAPLGRTRHVCALFADKDEEYRVLVPFIREGLEDGDKAFHVVKPGQRDDHLARLRHAGIDVEATQGRGQLEVSSWDKARTRTGRFDATAVLALIPEVLDRGKSQGFPLTRFVADMEWALEDLPSLEDLAQFETELDDILHRYDDPIVCTYDSSKFGGRIVVDVLRIHPVAVVGGILHENPWYVPPREFLKELRSRKR